jgi:hypothetical protein
MFVLIRHIIVHQYSETNVMQFLFNLLRIKGIYVFRSLLPHLQEGCTNGAANWQNMYPVQCFLRMGKYWSKHIEALNS